MEGENNYSTLKSSASDKLVFEVNGEAFEVPEVDPSTTLLEFLRSKTRFKSPKLGCGEGGCGACVVFLSKTNPELKQTESYTVSSCLTLLCSVNGCSITTSEGLGNTKDGFHPIHQRFAGFHASQCGFCTPGMCMSLFSALASSEKTNCPLTVSEAERAIMGNICRCTGYRPIADACKSFAADVDLEDLGINSFWRKGDMKETRAGKLPVYNPADHICPFTKEANPTRALNSERLSWYTPVSVDELRGFLKSSTVEHGLKTKLVVGNTGTGYYKETEKFDKYIDLRYIPELTVVKRGKLGIEFGAALSISKVISRLREESEKTDVWSRIADHMEKIASGFIRNSGSLGGNLVIAQSKYFPSDIATLLLAVDSSVMLLAGHEHITIPFEEFLYRPPLDPKDVLLSVHIPSIETSKSNNSNSKLFFETYRAAPRPLGNALPYLNAAFLADICRGENGILVNCVRLAFGAYGTKHGSRAKKVEEYLTGKILSVKVIDEAVKLVKDAIVSENGTSHPAYRTSLAVGFLFSFFTTVINAVGLSEDLKNDSLLEEAAKSIKDSDTSPTENEPLISSAKQFVEYSKDYFPVGEPMPKFGAAIQASGEAVYVDDIPSPPNCLHGALIVSTKPLARVKDISFESNPHPTTIADVITIKDIPKGGENVGAFAFFGSEPLFAGDVAKFAGDVLAFVVADTQRHANIAARTAVVDYDTDGLDPPILTVEEAVEFFDVPSHLRPEKVGDFSKGMAEADHKVLSEEMRLGSQYYFYMETQTALAVPDEDNCMMVYSSIQCPEYAHIAIARCLGVPENNVRVITRRLGGGFGGKALRAMTVATSCAIAAHKLRRPVRNYLDRKTDMIIAGGRHPMKITYTVGFKSNGKVTALHLDILINAGITTDVSPFMPHTMTGALKKYNWGALSFDIKLCKTNHSSKSAMRAPGDLQGSYIAEAILNRVADELAMEPDAVKNINFHTYESLREFYAHSAGELVEYTLPTIWDKVSKMSGFEEKIAAVENFNRCNIWRKRGVSRVPIVHQVSVQRSPGKVSVLWDGSVVVEVGGIEMGQGLWTKVKQVCAFALSSIGCDGVEGLVERVRVVQADTLSVVQGGFTSGSTMSEASCAAVRECCDVLVERLMALKKELEEEKGSVRWDDLILQAHNYSINLAAQSYYVPESSSTDYLNYGAAVSEVEVNILTGETTLLRTDLVYDCGQSMNPAVDLGQIEGAFVQGLGFFMLEEYLANEDGLVITDSTWTYKVPTLDNIPKQFNVEVLNSGHHQKRILSSKACGEPPLLLAASVHCATRAAIVEARKQLKSWGAVEGTDTAFRLDVPANMPVVKQLCGLNSVEAYLQSLLSRS
ncbi:indole-3-acetaldehyde oxidase [Phtheirospermum japonicum]|uniref:indole-3-acetaldehyde oxidase n=1 Tax=Phtheirospermum japonicum TaxID=374723 RepID=A0A830CLY7_9LAMI|nr:indole-3-acetaldehyde oxidase [Phtheirospermum japonicum]